MNCISPRLNRACQVATALIIWEIDKRRRLNPRINPDEIWASVTQDARIFIGTPLLHPGEGYYVDRRGDWEEV